MSTTPYTGVSVVDYLGSVGQASDFNSRANLATKYGITNYQGTADQNTQLLNYLRTTGGNSSTSPAPGTAATTAPNTGTTVVPPANTTSPAFTPTPVDSASIANMVRNGQLDPSQIDSYITGLATNAYTQSGANGTTVHTDQASTLANQIRQSLQGINFTYGGQNYQYTTGGAIKTSTTSNMSNTTGSGTTASTSAIPAPGTAPVQPTPVAPVATPAAPVTPVAPVAPAIGTPVLPVAPAAGGTAGGGVSTYAGPSVVDYLNSIGQSSDFSTRAALAAKMGIQNYTGTSSQNTQLLNTLRNSGGGHDVSTASSAASGAAGGAPASGTSTPGTGSTSAEPINDNASILQNAQTIAKGFGWTAPDPSNSPLNIATNLFTQGLSAFGLNDIQNEIKGFQAQQADLQSQQADDTDTINSNPWLTEGERVNRIAKLGDKYDTKLDILVHQQQLAEADYKTGLDQVQWQVGQAMTAYNAAEASNDKILSEALTVAQNVVQSSNTLKASQASASKPVEVSAGNTLYDPVTKQPIYTAPSKAVSSLTTPATNDAAVRAGVDVSTFQSFPSDVQAFFSQKSDAAIDPIKTALTDVAAGKKKASDFNTQITNGDFGSLSPAVQTFLKSQAAEAEKSAPANSNGTATWWNPLSWF